MANIRDITGKNREFTGLKGIKMPEGTTAQRPASPRSGELRFNTTLGLAEYHTGIDWKSIDSPPVITQFTIDGGPDVTSGGIDSSAGGNATIQVKGSLFDTTGAEVTFVGSNETLPTISITRNSSILLTVTVARSGFDDTNEPYAIKVQNGSGLTAQMDGAIFNNLPPVFATPADTNIGAVAAGMSDFSSFTTVAATDPDNDSITHTISAGTLPSGMSLGTNGIFTGTVGSDTLGTYTFTVSAATTNATVTRQFVVSYVPEGNTEYTSSGSHTFTVPANVTSVCVVCVGGGGSGASGNSGQAGAGGALVYKNGITVVPAQTAAVVVGNGPGQSGGNGQAGGASSFTYGGLSTTAGGGGGANGTSSGGTGGTQQGSYTAGGDGGDGGTDPANHGGPGGGGAGGYSGSGGDGRSPIAGNDTTPAATGSGGGGGGGGKGGQTEMGGGGGGGVGIYGTGANGTGGTSSGTGTGSSGGGGGGSGGSAGSSNSGMHGGTGGNYGGGHGGSQGSGTAGTGAVGAVRVIWGPGTRTFPSNAPNLP
jgi:hypothetical protein